MCYAADAEVAYVQSTLAGVPTWVRCGRSIGQHLGSTSKHREPVAFLVRSQKSHVIVREDNDAVTNNVSNERIPR